MSQNRLEIVFEVTIHTSGNGKEAADIATSVYRDIIEDALIASAQTNYIRDLSVKSYRATFKGDTLMDGWIGEDDEDGDSA